MSINSPGMTPGSTPGQLRETPPSPGEKVTDKQDVNSFSKEMAENRTSIDSQKNITDLPSPNDLLGTVQQQAIANDKSLAGESGDKISKIIDMLKAVPESAQAGQVTIDIDASVLPNTKLVVNSDNGKVDMTFETTSPASLQWLNNNHEAFHGRLSDNLGLEGITVKTSMPAGAPPSPEMIKPFMQELATQMAGNIQPLMDSGNAWSESGPVNLSNNSVMEAWFAISGSENNVEMTMSVPSKETVDVLNQMKDFFSSQLASELNGNVNINLNIQLDDGQGSMDQG